MNGTLVLGGGFGGAHVARRLGAGGATVVNPESSMLFTPLLPEVAAGAIEPRHVFVPLRMTCPGAELVRGRAVGLDETRPTVTVASDVGVVEIGYRRLVIALGSMARMLPIPGLAEHAITFKTLADAIHLRNHVIRMLVHDAMRHYPCWAASRNGGCSSTLVPGSLPRSRPDWVTTRPTSCGAVASRPVPPRCPAPSRRTR